MECYEWCDVVIFTTCGISCDHLVHNTFPPDKVQLHVVPRVGNNVSGKTLSQMVLQFWMWKHFRVNVCVFAVHKSMSRVFLQSDHMFI